MSEKHTVDSVLEYGKQVIDGGDGYFTQERLAGVLDSKAAQLGSWVVPGGKMVKAASVGVTNIGGGDLVRQAGEQFNEVKNTALEAVTSNEQVSGVLKTLNDIRKSIHNMFMSALDQMDKAAGSMVASLPGMGLSDMQKASIAVGEQLKKDPVFAERMGKVAGELGLDTQQLITDITDELTDKRLSERLGSAELAMAGGKAQLSGEDSNIAVAKAANLKIAGAIHGGITKSSYDEIVAQNPNIDPNEALVKAVAVANVATDYRPEIVDGKVTLVAADNIGLDDQIGQAFAQIQTGHEEVGDITLGALSSPAATSVAQSQQSGQALS